MSDFDIRLPKFSPPNPATHGLPPPGFRQRSDSRVMELQTPPDATSRTVPTHSANIPLRAVGTKFSIGNRLSEPPRQIHPTFILGESIRLLPANGATVRSRSMPPISYAISADGTRFQLRQYIEMPPRTPAINCKQRPRRTGRRAT